MALRHLRKNSLESYPIDDAPAGLLELRADEYTDYSDLEAVKLQKAINSLPDERVVFIAHNQRLREGAVLTSCEVSTAFSGIVRMRKAINSLPEKQRVAFNLRYYDELSYEEIAEWWRCGRPTI